MPSVATAAPSSSAMPNPALRLDPGLGLVVLQFRDDRGEVVATLPTERELAAYRDAGKRAASAPGLRPQAGVPKPGQEPGSGAARAASLTAASTPAEVKTPAVATPSASAVTTPPSPAPPPIGPG
ncbi:hypothetical protein GCM10011504_04750 [Siccirubricoccus deserti]|nr:hypothetical protein GCM10011504_04750 [Siccirubricoccus deserti]